MEKGEGTATQCGPLLGNYPSSSLLELIADPGAGDEDVLIR